ncbi:Actin-related protein 2/3 complex subunit [Lachnellula subtilissima]|uniref:Actin-related protein 2/3 complex subunit 5 n=1 Tax=Lachnellula subtilissima TaxID=602034 RepID=A0A8H8UFT8_9HELO|nr:Actin-related protein 2/3 complex subunit [Lachnellula subtilissima]
MSIIQQVSTASLSDNWRTINIDALDPESSSNFDTTTLHPAFAPVSDAEIRNVGQQVKQLLRGGDAEGALRGALESAPYGGDAGVKEVHLQTVTEVLQSIKASDMTPMLQRIFKTEGGSDALDVLMKYLYKGMGASSTRGLSRGSTLTPQSTGAGFSQMGGRPPANESSGSAMSVLLSWHEKVVDVAGQMSIAETILGANALKSGIDTSKTLPIGVQTQHTIDGLHEEPWFIIDPSKCYINFLAN